MADKVLFAENAVTVHLLQRPDAPVYKDQFGREVYDTYSQVLAPGQTVPANQVPPYVLESVEAGDVAGLKVMSESEAKKLLEQAGRIRTLLETPEYMYASGWDNSHSDFLVSDMVKAEALGAAGAGEPADEVPSGQVPEGEPEPVNPSGVTVYGPSDAAAVGGVGAQDTGENVATEQAAAAKKGAAKAKGDSEEQ